MNDSTAPDQDLRELFADATADVRPEGSFEDVLERIRTEEAPVRRWFLPAAAAATVIGLAIGGAAYLGQHDEGSKHGPGPAQFGPPVPATIWYVGNTDSASHPNRGGHGLFQESHDVPSLGGKPDLVAAGNLVLNGVPDDPDYSSPWPAGSSVANATRETVDGDDVIVVRLAGSSYHQRPRGMDDRDQMLAIDTLTRTLIQAAGGDDQTSVEFDDAVGNGDTVLGEDTGGERFAGGVSQDTGVVSPVQITSLQQGQTVPVGDLTVEGLAATYESKVVWELLVGGDAIVQNGTAPAPACCQRGPFSFTVKDLQPGTYTLVVRDTDSTRPNAVRTQDTKDFTVQ